MSRNHARVNQVSDVMLSSWRGNCDVQIFIYESNPEKPQYDKIARVTDYTVGYACKDGQKLKEEKEQLIGLTNMYCDQEEDQGAKLPRHATSGKATLTRVAFSWLFVAFCGFFPDSISAHRRLRNIFRMIFYTC